MTMSYGALCSDFYVNMKLGVRMELPRSREPVLELFERMRREYPRMATFKRYKDELALESSPDDTPHRWMAIRANSVRTGVVNPGDEHDMHALHRTAIEVCPYYLSISPLDLESIELLYGFDLTARGNHDEIVAQALLAGSPLAALLEAADDARVHDCQPVLGLTFGAGRIQSTVEIKTRSRKTSHAGERPGEPISIYVTVRTTEPITDLKVMASQVDELAERGRTLVDSLAIPNLLVPIRDEIGSSSL
ncbi:MAG: hypothetical protein LAT64_07620 [Phycisphaerales bacterium]|nr:hypothetical protein [Planctomycetota bacterium]MCH8508625.1 hypothetical protein [Phycisphaerales bacterium]